jgi:hypothetical protein
MNINTYLLIITKEKINIPSSIEYLHIDCDFTFIDDATIKIDNDIYSFTYLIYSNKINVTYPASEIMILENGIPLTNWLYQTSIENIYYLTENNLQDKINEILEN